MIYITGDTHGDFRKISPIDFPQGKKGDFVIICGDFGGIWNENEQEKSVLNKLTTLPFDILFIDGNHENFNLLNNYPIETWKGGRVHRIKENIYHLMRGQIFTIEGKKFFTFGGASSVDKVNRTEFLSWWREEMPKGAEFEIGFANLEEHNWKVDYIITHDCSNITLKELFEYSIGLQLYTDSLKDYFDILEKKVNYRHWYFGHHHDNGEIDDKHTVLYQKIISL